MTLASSVPPPHAGVIVKQGRVSAVLARVFQALLILTAFASQEWGHVAGLFTGAGIATAQVPQCPRLPLFPHPLPLLRPIARGSG